MTIGKYTEQVKIQYLKTKPFLDLKELVMIFHKGRKTIKNQIMGAWERPYMKKLARITTLHGGNVLEVGYGMGISAGFIQQSRKIKNHTIIECHPLMIENLKSRFKKKIKKGKVIVREGFWEDVTKKMPPKSFDGILFDSCPLDKEVEFFQFFPFFNEAFRLLKDDGVFTYFSDEPLKISPKHMEELKKSGFKNIKFAICKVKPPKNCLYWKHNTIIVPIVKK